jgi:hypothetical protein
MKNRGRGVPPLGYGPGTSLTEYGPTVAVCPKVALAAPGFQPSRTLPPYPDAPATFLLHGLCALASVHSVLNLYSALRDSAFSASLRYLSSARVRPTSRSQRLRPPPSPAAPGSNPSNSPAMLLLGGRAVSTPRRHRRTVSRYTAG